MKNGVGREISSPYFFCVVPHVALSDGTVVSLLMSRDCFYGDGNSNGNEGRIVRRWRIAGARAVGVSFFCFLESFVFGILS